MLFGIGVWGVYARIGAWSNHDGPGLWEGKAEGKKMHWQDSNAETRSRTGLALLGRPSICFCDGPNHYTYLHLACNKQMMSFHQGPKSQRVATNTSPKPALWQGVMHRKLHPATLLRAVRLRSGIASRSWSHIKRKGLWLRMHFQVHLSNLRGQNKHGLARAKSIFTV